MGARYIACTATLVCVCAGGLSCALSLVVEGQHGAGPGAVPSPDPPWWEAVEDMDIEFARANRAAGAMFEAPESAEALVRHW